MTFTFVVSVRNISEIFSTVGLVRCMTLENIKTIGSWIALEQEFGVILLLGTYLSRLDDTMGLFQRLQ